MIIRQAMLLRTVLLTCAGAAFGVPTAVGANDKAGAAGRPAVAAVGNQYVFPVDRRLCPYYPSLLPYTPSKATFTAPEICWGCHQQQYQDWRGSMHVMAYRDPIYQSELNKAVQAIGLSVTTTRETARVASLRPALVTPEKKGGLRSTAWGRWPWRGFPVKSVTR